MSRPVRDLTIEDLGQLKALSHFKIGKIIYWNVTCPEGTVHQFTADALTRKRYPVRSCGVCGRAGYLDQAVYLPTHMHTFGWLLPMGHFRRGDIREIALTRQLLNTPGKFNAHPYWSCRCLGRSLGHADCLGWVDRSTRELRNKSKGSCTVCRPHYRLARLEEFARMARDEEQRGHLYQLPENQQHKLTRSSYHCIVNRVKRIEKYRRLGMYEGWQGEGGYDRMVAHVGLRKHSGLTLHRTDNDRGYFPGNVEWATKKKQAEERSTSHFLEVEGQSMNLSALASILGKKPSEVGRQLSRLMASGQTEVGAVERIMEKLHSVH
jgi:hypothetical protein